MSGQRPWAISAFCEKVIVQVKAARGLFGGVRLNAGDLVEVFRTIQRRAEAEARELEVLRIENARLRSRLAERTEGAPPTPQA